MDRMKRKKNILVAWIGGKDIQNGLMRTERETQLELLNKLRSRLDIDRTVQDLFHLLRTSGNHAYHEFVTSYKDAMDGIKVAGELVIWYHRPMACRDP